MPQAPAKPSTPDQDLVQALGRPDDARAGKCRAALAAGARMGSAALRAYLAAPSHWSDTRLQSILGPALPPIGKLATWPAAHAKSAIQAALRTGGSRKLEWLMDEGLPAWQVGEALATAESRLDAAFLGLLGRALKEGFSPSREQVLDWALGTEDDARSLVLARHGLLDPNQVVTQDAGSPVLTFAQYLALYSRTVDLLPWLEVGADFKRPLANGHSLVGMLLTPLSTQSDWSSPPIPVFRMGPLRQFVEMGCVDWCKPDSTDTTPLEYLRRLPGSGDSCWKALVEVMEHQAQVHRLAARLHVRLPEPSRAIPAPRM